MIPIFKWTLWQRRLSTFWWSIGVFALVFINMIFYPSFREDANELQESFENLPDAALQLMGGSTDFFSPEGFLNSQVFFLMLPLVLGILAIGLGSSLIGREERDKTLEQLLAKPISRSRVLLAKGLAGVVVITWATFVGWMTTIVTAEMVDLEVPLKNMTLATVACYLLVLSFGAIALVLTAIGRTRGGALAIATTFALGGYLVSSLAGTVKWLEVPSKIFPFEYYKSEALIRGNIDLTYWLFFAAVILICGVVAWWSFRRRDLA